MALVKRTQVQRFVAILPVSFGVGGCIDGFGAGTAYDDQRFLCADEREEEWEQRRADCLAAFLDDDACAGVVSFSGTLESQAVTVDTDLVDSTFKFNQDILGTFDLVSIVAVGPTPYFTLSFNLGSVGGATSTNLDGRDLELDQAAASKDGNFDDDLVSISLRLTGGGDSVSLEGRTGTGQVHLSLQTFRELTGTFSGQFGGEGNDVDGCFSIFPVESILNIETGILVRG